MKAKLFLDEGRLELDGTPEEIAAYVKAIVPPIPGPFFVTTPYAQGTCTCGTGVLCTVHTMTFPVIAAPSFKLNVTAPACGFSAAEIGRLTSGATSGPVGSGG